MLLTMFTAAVFAATLNRHTYQTLLKRPARQTGVFACALCLALIWQIQAGILEHLNIHILGITAATLVMGWRLAALCALLASLLLLYFTDLPVNQLAEFLLFSALIPIYLSYALYLLCYQFLPRHFFVYIFVCAFLCAGFVGAAKILISGGYFYLLGLYDLPTLLDNYMFYSVIMWFPEAMLNGMVITLLITYRPHRVKTFYDQEYLNK
ncbi:energy-coupling factor ABC transporter permease [Pseudoalteromonas sp. MMG022]|uniref:energy-coupling factor ABC transporter permease n=1 Tax=Pseudoalteromonas sp. MMG022 TaxID=2909978 RepID=UPI001F003FFE|nr:energy-coupling factor ABC transporter permease [Pseudoalteromonas sp. MMG022]MCF6436165.1 energy-coupling factor ABC transporter permease [Pseudoalteromonas sp. MMG022]